MAPFSALVPAACRDDRNPCPSDGASASRPRCSSSYLAAAFACALVTVSMTLHAIGLDLEPLPGASSLVAPRRGSRTPATAVGGSSSSSRAAPSASGRTALSCRRPFSPSRAGKLACCIERGLLALAFHSDFATNGYFFVNYTEPEPVDPPSCPPPGAAPAATRTRSSRASACSPSSTRLNGDPNFADFATEQRILRYNQPFAKHNFRRAPLRPGRLPLHRAVETGGRKAFPLNFAQSVSTCSARSSASTSMRRRRRITACAATRPRPMPQRPVTHSSVRKAATRSGTSGCAIRGASPSTARPATCSSATSANGFGGDRLPPRRKPRRGQLGLAVLRRNLRLQHRRLRSAQRLSLPHLRVQPLLRAVLGHRRIPLPGQPPTAARGLLPLR